MKTSFAFCFRPLRAAIEWLAAVLCIVLAGAAYATHISAHTDINILRPPMPMEGYLNFNHGLTRLPGGGGEERTGWTDIRHPAQATLALTPGEGLDKKSGYDRSDNYINAGTIVLRDSQNILAPSGGIKNDFDFANRAWAQAGLSFIEIRTDKIPADGTPGNFTFKLDEAARKAVMASYNFPGTTRVEVYYTGGVTAVTPLGVVITPLGVTHIPSFEAGEKNEGIFMANPAGRSDVLAHELGHFLLDAGNGQSNAVHDPAPGDPAHSNDPFNIVAKTQYSPGSKKDEWGPDTPGPDTPLWDIDNNIKVVGIPMSTREGGSPLVGGVNLIDPLQIKSVFSGLPAQGWLNISNDHGLSFGDRADFDWVEDNLTLSLVGGKADSHPKIDPTDANDAMIWEIAPASVAPPSPHRDLGHNHDNWGELERGAFDGTFFRTIDIFSQISRYIDSDIDSTGDLSRRESALDFRGVNNLFPEFSNDGNTWLQGQLINVFIPGWNPDLDVLADDYVSRWRSPINATSVRLLAHEHSGVDAFPDYLGGHDGNVQIDAIIASREILTEIPEPGILALLGVAAAGLLLAGCGSSLKRNLSGQFRSASSNADYFSPITFFHFT